MTNRYSVNAMYSLAAEQDVEADDDLARGESEVFFSGRIAGLARIAFLLERGPFVEWIGPWCRSLK